jgi:hypothetical protein
VLVHSHRSSFVPPLVVGLFGLWTILVAACHRDRTSEGQRSDEAVVTKSLPNGFTFVDDSALVGSAAPFVGIIVSQAHAAEFAVAGGETQSFWTPAVSDVLKLARAMREQLHRHDPRVASRLQEYRFQVVGVVRGGRHLLFVDGFCKAPTDWRERPVRVKDGGDCYFRLSFEPLNGVISEFSVNGEA